MQTLREAREDAGVKQKAMAEKLGITRQTYARYELDPSKMTVGQAMACCEFLHRPMSEIFMLTNVR